METEERPLIPLRFVRRLFDSKVLPLTPYSSFQGYGYGDEKTQGLCKTKSLNLKLFFFFNSKVVTENAQSHNRRINGMQLFLFLYWIHDNLIRNYIFFFYQLCLISS